MEVLLNIAAGILTPRWYFNKKSANDHQINFNNYDISKSCVKSTQKQLLDKYVNIAFADINYSVSLGFRKGRQRILRGVNGKFASGQLTAIIGTSGSGKTTLLDILSGYRKSDIQGTIYINETPRNLSSFKKVSCYITHYNCLYPFLTVWESMTIVSNLKLASSIMQNERNIIIIEILTSLYLDKSLNTKVSQLSGGEQKRLSIALELIDNPLVMFLDEPTTGLDSYSCNQGINLLQRLARKGKTIVCTIHQPSAALIQLFDQIYILGEGQCIYQGTAQNLLYFLENVNLHCPIYHNPTDFVIELTSGEYRKQTIAIMMKTIQNGKNFEWTESPRVISHLEKLKQTSEDGCQELGRNSHHRASHYDQFKILLNRGYLRAKRDAKLTYMRLLVNVLSGLLYGTLYWQTGEHGGKVRNNYSLLFCVLIHHMMSTMMLTILTFPSEMPILIKEQFNRWYSLKIYYAATTICDIPILILCCLLFTTIVYPMSGQPFELHRVAMFTTISILVVLTVQSFGLIIGSMFNVVNGTFIGFSLSILMMMLAGFGEGLKDLPLNLYWACYASYMRYGFEGIVTAIYGYDRGPLFCPEDQYCHYKYPKKFLKDISMQVDQFWVDVLGLCVIFLVLKILTLFVLHWRLKNAR